MPYLTFEEFRENSLNDELTEEEFSKLLPRASSILDIHTNNFYVFNDLNDDFEYRANRFKQALSAQIQYFAETGTTSYYELNKTPQSFSAGRTSVTNSSSYNPRGQNESTPLVAEEVYLLLEGTGLLYRGVRS